MYTPQPESETYIHVYTVQVSSYYVYIYMYMYVPSVYNQQPVSVASCRRKVLAQCSSTLHHATPHTGQLWYGQLTISSTVETRPDQTRLYHTTPHYSSGSYGMAYRHSRHTGMVETSLGKICRSILTILHFLFSLPFVGCVCVCTIGPIKVAPTDGCQGPI